MNIFFFVFLFKNKSFFSFLSFIPSFPIPNDLCDLASYKWHLCHRVCNIFTGSLSFFSFMLTPLANRTSVLTFNKQGVKTKPKRTHTQPVDQMFWKAFFFPLLAATLPLHIRRVSRVRRKAKTTTSPLVTSVWVHMNWTSSKWTYTKIHMDRHTDRTRIHYTYRLRANNSIDCEIKHNLPVVCNEWMAIEAHSLLTKMAIQCYLSNWYGSRLFVNLLVTVQIN